jgi:predicted enzyme related to lactoylglutathione lyase
VPLEERRRTVDAKAEQLVQQGAHILRIHDQPEREPDYYGVVMQDPEGNEFCLQ